jgi:hypothetical protein
MAYEIYRSHWAACPEGCCLVGSDLSLGREIRDVLARPMYQVLQFHDEWADPAVWTADDDAVPDELWIARDWDGMNPRDCDD